MGKFLSGDKPLTQGVRSSKLSNRLTMLGEMAETAGQQ
jgi:hypothetical protein